MFSSYFSGGDDGGWLGGWLQTVKEKVRIHDSNPFHGHAISASESDSVTHMIAFPPLLYGLWK
jgi:hypothetical protein